MYKILDLRDASYYEEGKEFNTFMDALLYLDISIALGHASDEVFSEMFNQEIRHANLFEYFEVIKV